MDPTRAVSRGRLIGFYLLYFGTVGVTLPFLPAYFRSLGFSATQIGVLLALAPTGSLLMPPLFGHLADRTGRPDRVLTFLSFGALAGIAPLLFVERFAAVFAAYAVYACFVSSITTLVDSLALQRVAIHGGSYAHLRLFGSLGYVISTVLLGLLLDEVDHRVAWAVVALVASYALWSIRLRASAARGSEHHGPLEGLKLLRNRDVVLLLIGTSLHWIALGPFNGTFGIHITALGLPPWVIGTASGIGVAAEVAVMLLYPRIAARFAPRHVLFFSFAATALRWAVMAWTSNATVILSVSAIHGVTFGTFYIAAVSFMAARVPPNLRASGQALYVSITYGVGGLVAFLCSGAGYDLLGGHRLFGVAAAIDVVAALIALRLHPPPSVPDAPVVASGRA